MSDRISVVRKRLDQFLQKRVSIERGNERAKASQSDAEEFEALIQLIAEAKWQPSYDGAVPVEVTVVNRSTHERLPYQPLPYQENKEKLDVAILNLQIAARQVDLASKLCR